ncbi:MAG: hypothetical protein GXP42_17480 [Chloroflexi bacterium]|nr:hypothetical protein [Chloroflexota bacterium]
MSFVALRDLLAFIAERPEGLRAKDMEELARQERKLRTRDGRIPSKTTVYHYRTILYRLGILTYHRRRYIVNQSNPIVRTLVQRLKPGSSTLSVHERRLFSELVVANVDCRYYFFDLFMPKQDVYVLEDFIAHGRRVAWKSYTDSSRRMVHLRNLNIEKRERWLQTEDEFQAILYGIRYWARNELEFIDELFLEDLGGVMFPVTLTGPVPAPEITVALAKAVDDSREWTILSVRKLVYMWGPRYHISLKRIFQTLLSIYRDYSEYIVLIPTSEAFATITATSPGAGNYQLRSYLRDFEGRYISHIRVHRKLKEALQWTMLTPA